LILQKYLIGNETKKEFLERISFGNTSLMKVFRNREGIWGGRNLYAIGREGNITGSNCYVATDPEDSLEDIYRADFEIAKTYSYGGGQGLNLSKLRPRGSKVNNSSNTSPGVMVFAEKYSHTTLNTQQESRRGALMLVMNINHPDVIDFITAKLDIHKIEGANISLAITDEFMRAYQANENWELKFETRHEVIVKTVNARDLMNLIAYAAHTMGDPGMIFINRMNDYHLLSEYDEVKFTATNPCGEQPLMANGSCNLGSINLNAFVRKEFTPEAYFDLSRFSEVVETTIRGLDQLLDMLGDRHALAAQRQHVTDWREVGLGLMGLADLALTMGVGYGTPDFIRVLDTIMATMANSAAQASAKLAKEKGVFPKYDYDKISKSKFFQDVYTEETKNMIKEFGLRNSRLLSIAPTGSISNILGVSGGVEPYFMLGYQRIIKSMFEEEKAIWVYEKTPLRMIKHFKLQDHTKLPGWAQITSQNINIDDRLAVQQTIQKYVDTAISSTFNLPNYATTNDVLYIYVRAWELGLKGVTVFRDNCKKIGILSNGGANFDHNPAPKPKFTISEFWLTRKTNTINEYITSIQIEDKDYKAEKINLELCPICGAPLVKQGGCTKCSNNECVYEKCAI
jgi:ribonucleoside-diphosphate reductase alpha chain